MSEMEDRAGRLQRAMHGKTQAWVASSVGIATSSINGYLQGKVPPADTCLRLCDVLGIEVRWYLTGETSSVDSGEKVVQVALVDAPQHALTFPESLVSTFDVPVESLASFVVRGTLMAPGVPEGAELLATRSFSDAVDGQVYILRIGDRFAVRRVVVDANGVLHALCDNPQVSPRIPDVVQYPDIVAWVLWFGHRIAAPSMR